MNVSDLETYEYQLSQIKLALAKDPTNTDYLTLKDELTSLIDLTREYLDSITSSTPTPSTTKPSTSTTEPQPRPKPKPSTSTSQPTSTSTPIPTSSKPTYQYQAGQECLAKYSGDHKYYPCRITTVGGSDENRVFSIIFHGYETTEVVALKDLKPLPTTTTTSTQTGQVGIGGSEGKKRSGQVEDPEAIEKERKRKKYEKKAETQANKTQEQGLKQKSWQTFAKKGAKKGVVIPGIQGASMFKSPEDLNPQARGEFPITFPSNARMNRTLMIFNGECTVGVVGSGRGMTKSLDKKKQSFV
ncbi:BZ3500_MvSof-1268-A1-R1_Chr2-2g04806 [Microbotryum saponariae]|uniref:BZ3500_MvSof-1268-A1-R1_Chr2-2g04806 protein n=1 Tax=Microbotryum saponariae TaxID=289078 RepID=A0A2X0N638_9BASI|nr:BZ3500_MvSof-1268-A1-R1_Chr2-2g04806 [Microbotryum saponariae]SDA00207.1 BZ3501_MvSof-1269-A2-R1_Chr2-2g04480 [Microbotryum saponariae]